MKNNQNQTGNSKVSKILIAIIAVLVIAVVGLVIALVSSKGKEENDNTTREHATKTDVTSETATKTATATDSGTTEQQTEITMDFVSVVAVNAWESDGRYFSQFDVKVTNSSNDVFTNWKLDIKVPTDTLLSDIWNGTGVVKDGILSIEAQDYNKEIQSGAALSDLGFIISTKDKDGLLIVGQDNAFYSNGTLVDGLVVVAETTPTEEATQEQTTEEVVSNTPPKKEEGTPFANHGKLSLDGTDIVDENGERYQ